MTGDKSTQLPTPHPSTFHVLAYAVLFGAAALGYLSEFLTLQLFDEKQWSLGFLGLIFQLPSMVVVAAIQNFGFDIRQGKSTFVRTLTQATFRVTAVFFWGIALLLWLIPLAIRRIATPPGTPIVRYVVLMLGAYLATFVYRHLRKLPE